MRNSKTHAFIRLFPWLFWLFKVFIMTYQKIVLSYLVNFEKKNSKISSLINFDEKIEFFQQNIFLLYTRKLLRQLKMVAM